ncbi:hypothetical protein UPYG_G00153740 [Umbra pygmaea]|uniref:Uncharacterized protein n=1 Tax=Umbra pygmaea TaxID=75934 RepID=A0ABD0WXU8_UMBPY
MSPSVLLLLSILTVQGNGCEHPPGVKNLKPNIDSSHRGFREVFPKDYTILHHYSDNLLCDTDPCCVFQAATVLSDSWIRLRRQLWEQHHSFKLITDIITTLGSNGITSNKFEYHDDFTLPDFRSSPENLLNFTSSFLSKWLEIECPTSVDTCSSPTLSSPTLSSPTLSSPAQMEQPVKAISKTTRAVRQQGVDEGDRAKRIHDTQPPTNTSQASAQLFGFIWSLLFLFGQNCIWNNY